MDNKTLKLLVVSDLHAVVNPDFSDDTRLFYKDGVCEFADGIIAYIKELKCSIDLIICPGDIGNKADTESFQAGWSFLTQVSGFK